MEIQQSQTSFKFLSLKKFKRKVPDENAVETDFKETLIGQIIKQAREGQQITQEELAEMLGINKSNISKIENNLTSIRMGTFFKLMEALDTKLTLRVEFDNNSKK